MLLLLPKREFLKRLKKRKLEDLGAIRSIESMLLRKRGYIFRMPKPGDPVILLLSGGIDSIVSWNILMERYSLNVYPIFLDKGEKRKRREIDSIRYFSDLYKKSFPNLYHEPFYSDAGGASLRMSAEEISHTFHPKTLLDLFNEGGTISVNTTLGIYMAFPVYAKIYSEHLFYTQNILIRTIFCSVVSSDGTLIPYQTFTALRSIMAYLCITSGDISWQYSSVAFEKETGIFWDKADLIYWADAHNLPLEKTWSCFHNGKYQCGDKCISCYARRQQFNNSGIQDRTVYISLSKRNLVFKIKQAIKRVLALCRLYIIKT
jgi:7-cyano-7-deazaguanine synthase in queuosine biosynthesis